MIVYLHHPYLSAYGCLPRIAVRSKLYFAGMTTGYSGIPQFGLELQATE
jgi:hypothetical protein